MSEIVSSLLDYFCSECSISLLFVVKMATNNGSMDKKREKTSGKDFLCIIFASKVYKHGRRRASLM